MAINPATFFGEVRTELGKVVWPSREQTTRLTVVVLVLSVVIGFFVGGLDIVLTNIEGIFIKR